MSLNEVTVTIMNKDVKTNYHETFMLDVSKTNVFKFKGQQYNMPPDRTYHYSPGTWDIIAKMAMFFEYHKTTAKFFDWFGTRKRACHAIGYLYWEGEPDPITITQPERDYALENYNLQHNTTLENTFKDADKRLSGQNNDQIKLATFIGLVIIGIVVAAVILWVYLGGAGAGGGVQPFQNITTPTTTPLPVIPIPTIGGH